MKLQLCSLIALVAIAAFATSASADVIFSDSFDRVTGNDDVNSPPVLSSWGDNDNALGGASVQTYTMNTRGGGAQNTTNGSEAVIKNGASQVELDLTSLAPLGYTVALDFTRTAGNGFVAVGIGLDDTDQIENTGGFNGNAFLFLTPANGAEGAVVLRQTNGTASDGTVELWNGAAAPDKTIDSFFADRESTQSLLITVSAPNGYGAGAAGTLITQIGSSIESIALTFDGVSSGFLSFYSNQTGSTLDNLVVTAIPEPATVGLIGLAMVSFAAVRRRA